MRYLITGGAGFIGSAVARHLIKSTNHEVLVVDKLTYAGNLDSLQPVSSYPRFHFERADVADSAAMRRIHSAFSPDIVMHLAAESHVDRSIDGPADFIQTNIVGTFVLLQTALDHWRQLPDERKKQFRFHHISTDEVFGSLGPTGAFDENSRYEPNSPYSASKASADHLARAWFHTYGLPVVLTNCSNNYGPYHFPEKLIPLTIINALENKPISVYGNGMNVRDWLHVEDHAEALISVAERGETGESYNIGANSEQTNIDVVRKICRLVDELSPSENKRETLITFVPDRPGHDLRYAINAAKIERDLNWRPKRNFDQGLRDTVRWFIDNRVWWERIRTGIYRGDRLGAPV